MIDKGSKGHVILRIIYTLLFISFPLAVLLLYLYIEIIGNIYIHGRPILIPANWGLGVLIVCIFWWGSWSPLVMAFFLSPLYYKESDGYYYRKLLRKRKIESKRIKYIKDRIPVKTFFYPYPGYDVYMKGELFPLRLVMNMPHNVPAFAEGILNKFPPEDFPPPDAKAN